MENPTRVNVSFERDMAGKLPKSVGYSSLFRWAMHVALDSDKQFKAACLTDAGLAAAEAYMKERFLRLIGKQ